MAAQSVASRSSQPQHAAGADDVLAARALEFAQWARNNIRLILIGAVTLLVVVGGLIFYRVDQERRQQRAASEFMALEATVASGNVQLATRDLERFVRRFEGTTAADEATIALAQLQLRNGEAPKAVATLQPLASDIGGSALGPQAGLLLAAAQQAAGQRDAAIATYGRVEQGASLDLHRNEAIANAATLLEEKGDWAGAGAQYQKLIDSAEEGSLERSLYEMRLAEAQAHAAAR
jgi:predicted negative regulator of RcsB-dependent stress response